MFTKGLLNKNPTLHIRASNLLHQSQFQFARYLNKAQQMDQNYKYDASSYHFQPELIYRVTPRPAYPDEPLPPSAKLTTHREKTKGFFENFRDNSMTKKRVAERFMTGRLYAHLKHEELKKQVEAIHLKEEAGQQSKKKQGIKGVQFDEYDIDDTFKLPYGLGHDKVIKRLSDGVDRQKYRNIQAMDQLVQKLGYMDYRDALACNKYIIEAKKHSDYHQQARSRILSLAMSRYNALKRSEIEQKAAKTPDTQMDNKDEVKLNMILNEDPEMAQMYRDTYNEIKAEKEFDYNEATRLHNKYSYLDDDEFMSTRKPSKFGDVLDEDRSDADQPYYTTELSDPEIDIIYKRYKIIQYQNKTRMDELEDEALEVSQTFEGGMLRNAEGRKIKSSTDYINEMTTLFEQKQKRQEMDYWLEHQLAHVRLTHELNKVSLGDVYTPDDPVFGENYPLYDVDALENDPSIPLEIQKILFGNQMEAQDLQNPVFDEKTQRMDEDMSEFIKKYFRAKLQFHIRQINDQLKFSDQRMEDQYYNHELYDQKLQRKADFMFNYLDYDYDRANIRDKFIKEMNKKTTLQEIGEILDQLVLNEQAADAQYWNLENSKVQIKAAEKDTNNFTYTWLGKLFEQKDATTPLLLDDDSQLDNLPEGADTPYRDILDRVKYEDSRTDYSILTPDQRTEISLFHSFKQDPFYKHYLYNHLRQFCEEVDESIINFPHGPYAKEIYDHAKFDRINLYDFRRALPQIEREAKLDSKGSAWGFGKRKASRAIARLRPGKGTITINGKSLIDYFTYPSQRYRILFPLIVTQYTCLLDVNIWVFGGGFTGQPEAIVPAIAKALQNYDVKTRMALKYFGLMKHDTRQVERKKPGLIKARKGQVYRRR